MEHYIPFLVGILYYAFRVYSNYQKEQEKARKRNPGKPAATVADRVKAKTKETRQKDVRPQPFLLEEVLDPYKPYEPQYKHIYKEEKLKEVSRRAEMPKAATPKRVELNNPEVPADEILKNRAIHKPHGHQWDPYHEEVEPHYEFDFRDAIIKEAILNRPKY